ncbi:MAG: ribosome maturation factor RimM [Bacteroidales bacterium]|nr:ribosome maturation factor RimM [Bacteroidales bacterium]
MKVLKSYGTKGDVIINISPASPKDINLKEPVFITIDGLSVPFFIENFQEKGGTKVQIKFEDIDSSKAAEEIVGQNIILNGGKQQDNEFEEGDMLSINQIIGFTIYDQNKIEIGIVVDFYDIKNNPCLSVMHESKEVMIPFHEDLIINIKSKKKILVLNIPEGLI